MATYLVGLVARVWVPKVGQKWRLKSQPDKIATVINTDIINETDGYVYLKMPWSKIGYGGKQIDTFLKYYRIYKP